MKNAECRKACRDSEIGSRSSRIYGLYVRVYSFSLQFCGRALSAPSRPPLLIPGSSLLDRFEASNPTLESRKAEYRRICAAAEVTAYLRLESGPERRRRRLADHVKYGYSGVR